MFRELSPLQFDRRPCQPCFEEALPADEQCVEFERQVSFDH